MNIESGPCASLCKAACVIVHAYYEKSQSYFILERPVFDCLFIGLVVLEKKI